MLAGAALVAGTAFSFGHAAMSVREFQDLVREALPRHEVSFERGWDMYRDRAGGDPELITAAFGRNGRSKFTVDLRDIPSAPFARERLRASLTSFTGPLPYVLPCG